MAPTTTMFAFGPQLQPIFKTKYVLEAKFYKLSIFTFDDFYFQNGGNIKDGVFQIFNAFLQAMESLILNY
jgi:hypothetical protein